MISIQKNKNFPRWIQISAVGEFVDETKDRKSALRVGKQLARQNKLDCVYFLDNIVEVDYPPFRGAYFRKNT